MDNHGKIIILLFSLPFGTSGLGGRIVGGSLAQPGQFPFIISINDRDTKDNFCGGSIISKNWVVTAAHCLTDMHPEKQYDILAGTNIVNVGGTRYNISAKIPHPSYNPTTMTFDIGLVKIEGQFDLSETVQIIEIGEATANQSSTVTGWGLTRFSPNYPKTLHFAQVTALSLDDCVKLAKGALYEPDFGPGHVCATAAEGTGFCFGDSGGPLILQGKLVGVVSCTLMTCASGYPDVYTRVAYYAGWIDQIVQDFL